MITKLLRNKRFCNGVNCELFLRQLYREMSGVTAIMIISDGQVERYSINCEDITVTYLRPDKDKVHLPTTIGEFRLFNSINPPRCAFHRDVGEKSDGNEINIIRAR